MTSMIIGSHAKLGRPEKVAKYSWRESKAELDGPVSVNESGRPVDVSRVGQADKRDHELQPEALPKEEFQW